MEHTPTPWKTLGKSSNEIESTKRGNDELIVARTFGPDNEANARFIVQAVNSHDELLKGLNDNIQTLRTLPLHPQGSTAEISIAKAINNTRVIIANATKEG